MSDYRVTVKVRNARLLRAISNAGYQSITKFCVAAGVCYPQVNDLLNMTASPLDSRGKVRAIVDSIMDFLCEPFDALFSEAQCEALATNKTERDVSAEQVFALIHAEQHEPLDALCRDESLGEVRRLLDALPMRARGVLAQRNGFSGESEKLADIASQYDVTQERVRQIEQKALRTIRTNIRDNKMGPESFR